METYMCAFNHGLVSKKDYCPQCVERMKNRPDADSMTGDERAAELIGYYGKPLSVPFEILHKRLTQLVGRDLYTSEMGTSNLDNLAAEARGTRKHPEFLDEITATLPKDVEVHVIDLSDDGSREFSDN